MPVGLGEFLWPRCSLHPDVANHFTNKILADDGQHVETGYLMGRACHMTIVKQGTRRFIGYEWREHTKQQFEELLNAVGISPTPAPEANNG